MIILTNNKSTKLCQITSHIKKIIHKRKVARFFRLMHITHLASLLGQPEGELAQKKLKNHCIVYANKVKM